MSIPVVEKPWRLDPQNFTPVFGAERPVSPPRDMLLEFEQRSYNFDDNFTNSNAASISVDILKMLEVLRRWWWLIALIMTIVTAMTALILTRMQPSYLASTTLEIKQEERNIIDVSEVENIIADKEFLATQVELLKSVSLFENVIEKLNLVSDPEFYDEDDEAWQQMSRSERLSVVTERFEKRLRVAPVGRSRLIKLSFSHSNPVKAANITNTTVDTFIGNTLNRKFNTTKYAREFLEDRLKTVKTSLEVSEREFVEYASKNNIIIVSENDGQESTGSLDASALLVLDADLTLARTERFEAEAVYKQSLENSFSTEILENLTLNDLKAERIELQSEFLEKSAILKPDFPEMKELDSRITLMEGEIKSQKDKLISGHREHARMAFMLARAQELDLEKRVTHLKNSVINVREKGIDYNILRRQVETNRTQYDALLQRLKEVSVSDDLGSNLVQIVDKAKPPRLPFKPNKVRSLIFVIILSGAIGFGLTYVIEMIDDRVKAPKDVKTKLKKVIFGVIPMVKQEDELLQNLEDPQSDISEAYSSLRTNLSYSGADGGPKVIQLTSTRSGEGKSVSSLGIALRVAAIEGKILLIDCDMRLPTFLQGDGETIGLSGVLTTNTDFAPEIQATRFENLDLLPSGPPVPNPADLLSGRRFDELLAYAREKYRYVIIDSPPILGLADALILGAKVDATLLIVQSRLLRTPAIQAAIERFAGARSKLLGVVLTKYKSEAKGYMDYYKYSYGQEARQYSALPQRTSKKRKSKSKRKFQLT